MSEEIKAGQLWRRKSDGAIVTAFIGWPGLLMWGTETSSVKPGMTYEDFLSRFTPVAPEKKP